MSVCRVAGGVVVGRKVWGVCVVWCRAVCGYVSMRSQGARVAMVVVCGSVAGVACRQRTPGETGRTG